jgi:alpha-tubulin suppressor-like RCC1 family protein
LHNIANAQSIAAGEDHSFFLCTNGTVQGVGGNSSGQLGDGSNLSRITPVQLPLLTGVTGFDGGNWHSVFVKNDGTAWTVGRNNYGQLGDGTLVDKNIPLQVPGLTGITAVSGGSGYSVFLKNDGTVWSVGYNFFGELGDGTTVYKSLPVLVLGLTGIIAIVATNQFTLYLKNDGTVWASGRNQFGQFGNGTTSNFNTIPLQILGLTGITAISAGGGFSVFLKNDGTVWATGENGYGQLGDGTLVSKTTPVQVLGMTGITAVAVGTHHALFLKNDTTVWAVGHNNNGTLGDGTIVHKSIPVQPVGLCSVGLGIEESATVNAISVYPNPCNGDLFIELDGYQNTTAEIFNIQGQLVQNIVLQSFQTSLQINHLTSGVYLVQVKNPKGLVVKKIIKN